jgi:hypothetical protein
VHLQSRKRRRPHLPLDIPEEAPLLPPAPEAAGPATTSGAQDIDVDRWNAREDAPEDAMKTFSATRSGGETTRWPTSFSKDAAIHKGRMIISEHELSGVPGRLNETSSHRMLMRAGLHLSVMEKSGLFALKRLKNVMRKIVWSAVEPAVFQSSIVSDSVLYWIDLGVKNVVEG